MPSGICQVCRGNTKKLIELTAAVQTRIEREVSADASIVLLKVIVRERILSSKKVEGLLRYFSHNYSVVAQS